MKAIIHIGMPKTGSRSVLIWMLLNRSALKRQGLHTLAAPAPQLLMASIHVATNELGVDEKTAWQGWEGKPGARALGLEVDNNATREKVAEQKRFRAGEIENAYKFVTGELENLAGKSGSFIWLDERLYDQKSLIPSVDRILARFFDDRTYVAYIRNTADFFVSKYSQDLRDCDEKYGTMRFSEYLDRCASRSALQDEDGPLEHLFAWHSVVGERLNVRLAESDWLINGDMIDDFSSLIGVDAFRKPGRKNEAFAAEYIEYVRFLNRRFGRSLPDDMRRKIIKFLTASSSGKPKLAASDSQAALIHDVHRELEERTRESFFPDRPFLFSPKLRGSGVMPSPLTVRRKGKIESEISRTLAMNWNPYEIARGDRGK